ncbi:hypothetical protein CP8484711_0769, partial [Chlamydia psittaci 84-8471/1]
ANPFFLKMSFKCLGKGVPRSRLDAKDPDSLEEKRLRMRR